MLRIKIRSWDCGERSTEDNGFNRSGSGKVQSILGISVIGAKSTLQMLCRGAKCDVSLTRFSLRLQGSSEREIGVSQRA